MKLLDEIIELLGDQSGSLTGALLKTKILLHKIRRPELVEWVNNELNGYPNRETVPPYRVVKARVMANLTNEVYQANAHPIPTGHLERSYRESLERIQMQEGIGVLEKYLDIEDGHLQKPIPMEANGLLGKSLSNDYKVQIAWSEIQISGIRHIATQVRSRLLDFVLELNDSLGDASTDEEVRKRVSITDADNIFNNAIFGDNATVIIGSGNSQRVTATVTKGDFSTLADTLRSHGVKEEEIGSLRAAIAQDGALTELPPKTFGKSVKAWIEGMFSKTVEASWQIELSVAGSLFASALQRYYGWL